MHVTRTVVFAVASAVLAATATGSASAWSRTSTTPLARGAALVASPAASHTVTTAARTGVAAPAAARSAAAKPGGATKPAAAQAVATKSAAANRVATASGRSGVTISNYVNAPGSQRAINTCHLVLWTTRPLWLAAHNYCGFQWLAYVPTGKVITVTKGAAAGRYVVTGHVRLARQSGSMPRVRADLVLQTCVGSSTGLTLARRIR